VRQECLKEVENLRKRCLLSDNFDRFKYESEIMFNELKRKEANLRHMHDQLQEQTNNLAELNSRKADSERLWELKESLSNYVSLDIFG
jgi:DNA repair ATPase RecN